MTLPVLLLARGLGLFGLLVGPAVPQQAPVRDAGAVTAPPVGTGRISGVITEADDVPARRARVTVAGDMRLTRSTLTDEQGRYVVAGLPSGRFTVTADKPGSPPMSFGARQPFRTGAGLYLAEGEAADASFRLPRGAVITGTVRNEHGEPMPGVPVMAWQVRTALGGERTLDFVGTTPETVVSDDQGRYRVFGLPPGEFVIGTAWYFRGLDSSVRVPPDADYRAAFPPPGQTAPRPEPPGPAQFNYSPMFAPSAVDPLSGTSVRLSAGQEAVGVDLQMQFLPMARIEGTITHPEGKTISTRMSIFRRSGVSALNSGTQSPGQMTGAFSSGSLPPGPYAITVEVPAGPDSPALWAGQEVVLTPGDVTTVALTLEPALTASGTVSFVGAGEPPADLTRVAITLSHVGALSVRPVVRVDKAGTIAVTGLVPGRYHVRASVPAGAAPAGPTWQMASVRVGDEDVTDRVFEIRPATPAPLAVTFTDALTELTGRLFDEAGQPTADYFVIAMPEDRTHWVPQSRRIVSTRPDGSGRYVFRGLPPGAYRIAVTTDLVPADLQRPEVLEQLLPQSLAVTLTFDAPRTLDIRTTGR